MGTDGNRTERELRLTLISQVRHYGWSNLLVSFDTIAAAFVLAALITSVSMGYVIVTDKTYDAGTDIAIYVSLPMLALGIAALAIVTSLTSDGLLFYLNQRDHLHKIVFPFHWNSIVWFVSLLFGVSLKIIHWLFPVPGFIITYLWVVYVGLFVYALLSTMAVISSVQLFVILRTQFVDLAVNESQRHKDFQLQSLSVQQSLLRSLQQGLADLIQFLRTTSKRTTPQKKGGKDGAGGDGPL